MYNPSGTDRKYASENGLKIIDDDVFFSSWGVNEKTEVEAPVVIGNGWYDIGFIGAFSYINLSSRKCITNECKVDAQSIGRFTMVANSVVIGYPGHNPDFLSAHLIFRYGGKMEYFKDYLHYGERDIEYEKKMHDLNNAGCIKPFAKIGNDCWIGADSRIMNGVTIGDGAIIAAGAVVTKDVGSYEIWGGIPAKCIKLRFKEKTIEKLMKLKWWDYGPQILYGLDLSSPDEAVEHIQDRVYRGAEKFVPDYKLIIDSGNCNIL